MSESDGLLTDLLIGPCTATGGYLGFYEIQEILKQGAKPVHDTEAAVNYLVFDNDQWISFDDKVTFKQKSDWANTMGIGGSLIWASDLDDDKYSAHAALLGRTINPTSSLQDIDDLKQQAQHLSLTASVKGQTGEQCFKHKGKCVNLDDDQAMSDACGAGFTVVGWADEGCGKKNHHYGKPICCPSAGAPTSCQWRGDDTGGTKGDCSGECYEGEINVAGISSSWEGGFTNDGNTNKCRRGYKSFCCVAPDLAAIDKKCTMTECGKGCSSGYKAMFKYYSDCWLGRYKTYCCPDPSPVSQCHWVGDGGDCANVHCPKDEIELARDPYGDPDTDSWACSWGRNKAACCKIDRIEIQPATCSSNICEVIEGYCDSGDADGDDNDDDDDDDNDADDNDDEDDGLAKRDDWDDSLNPLILDKRGARESYKPPSDGPKIVVRALGYPGPSKLYTGRLGFQAIPVAFRLASQYCTGDAFQVTKFTLPPPSSIVTYSKPWEFQTEHVLDVSR